MQKQIYQRKLERNKWIHKQITNWLSANTYIIEDLVADKSNWYNIPIPAANYSTLVLVDWHKVIILPYNTFTSLKLQTTKGGKYRVSRQVVLSLPEVTILDRWF